MASENELKEAQLDFDSQKTPDLSKERIPLGQFNMLQKKLYLGEPKKPKKHHVSHVSICKLKDSSTFPSLRVTLD
jgi:hypothetical protein